MPDTLPSLAAMPGTQPEPVLPPCSLQQLPLLPPERPAPTAAHAELPLLSLSPRQLSKSRGHSLSPTATPSHAHRLGASPRTLLPSTAIRVRGHMPKKCSHPFPYSPSPVHTLAQPWPSPVIHAHPPAALVPTPFPTAPHTQGQHSHPFLHRDCFMQTHMHAHMHARNQRFAWFPMAIPLPPPPQESALTLCFTEGLTHVCTRPARPPHHL